MKFVFGIVIAGVVVAATGVFAETTLNSGGVASGTSDTKITALSETHMLVQSTSNYDMMKMASADHPYNDMSGQCIGSFEMRIPSATGGGHCVFSDAAGDTTITSFEATAMGPDGALIGTWAVVGGTGKFAGASGGGTFNSLTNRETGTFENKITGAMVMR